MTRTLCRYVGIFSKDMASLAGESARYTFELAKALLAGRLRFRHLIEQAAFVGVDTMLIALILTTFSGMVIALQTARELVKQGAGNYVGAVVSLAIVRELAPIMSGFAVIALAGSAFAAELGSMQTTNQVDALRMLRMNPVRFLMLPRALAGMLMLPMITTLTGISGLLGGLVISTLTAGITPANYLDSVRSQTDWYDVLAALTKAGVFGYLIAILSCTIGMNTRGGAREVGESTTQAVVWSFVAMAVADYVLTYLFYGSGR
jgi:phospholipid/cholesterol/gamma-HCH transport system permease protein